MTARNPCPRQVWQFKQVKTAKRGANQMRKIVVFASLLAAPGVAPLEPSLLADNPGLSNDPRTIRIKKLFEKNGCPLSKLSAEFVREADANDLDWRLLPSITFVE